MYISWLIFYHLVYNFLMGDERIRNLVKATVRRHLAEEYKLFVFGSRVVGTNRKFSDLDVGIMGPKPVAAGILVTLKDELDDSDIPYRVDVVDFAKVGQDFKRVALTNHIAL